MAAAADRLIHQEWSLHVLAFSFFQSYSIQASSLMEGAASQLLSHMSDLSRNTLKYTQECFSNPVGSSQSTQVDNQD
jgi:hypothetical protein